MRKKLLLALGGIGRLIGQFQRRAIGNSCHTGSNARCAWIAIIVHPTNLVKQHLSCFMIVRPGGGLRVEQGVFLQHIG